MTQQTSRRADEQTKNRTLSEQYFEQWCIENHIPWRRIKESRVSGHKRPDYAIKIDGVWAVVEVKQIDSTNGNSVSKLRNLIRSSSKQLKKPSTKGFPTVLCLFNMTNEFQCEDIHIIPAMFGNEALRFRVSENGGTFLGTHFGGNRTLTTDQNTSISVVTVLRWRSDKKIDLYHNPFARVPITTDVEAPFIHNQSRNGQYIKDEDSFNMFDFIKSLKQIQGAAYA